MLTMLYDSLWPLLLGALCGAAVFAMLKWRSKQAAAARCLLSAPAAVPPTVLLDTHLCLNVLNRFAIALDSDERLQIGVEHLGDYLAANHRVVRSLGSERLAGVQQVIDIYWQLSCWQGGRQAHAIVWHVSGDVATSHGVGVLINALQHLLASKVSDIETPHLSVEISNDADARAQGEPGTGRHQQVAMIRLCADAAAVQAPSTLVANTNSLAVRLPVSG